MFGCGKLFIKIQKKSKINIDNHYVCAKIKVGSDQINSLREAGTGGVKKGGSVSYVVIFRLEMSFDLTLGRGSIYSLS